MTRLTEKVKTLSRKRGKIVLAIVGLIIVFFIGKTALGAIGSDTGSSSSSTSVNIGKNFDSIGRTKDGRPTDGTLPIKLTNAQITDKVLVQGQNATARNGKTFIVIYLEVENKYQVPLYTTPLDLFRLVRSDGKRIAPSVSQGNVEVRPISVKRSNVAFVIDRNEKNFTIELGEIRGEKQAVQINFR
ncbi:MAG: DUF4352 domain-containing protein [bacterium]|nr:DUF4352 domain-containing protein [bacterium]